MLKAPIQLFKLCISEAIRNFRPLFGFQGCCKYHLSCTQFATKALQEHSLPLATWRIIKRILSCW